MEKGIALSVPSSSAGSGDAAARTRVRGRLGLNVPYEWWPRAATVKGIEAAGFQWLQVASPPIEMLADPRHVRRYSLSLCESLEVTRLNAVVHGPTNLRLGSSLHDRAGEGLIEYARQIGANHVVYHALDVSELGPEAEAEESSLRYLARRAESADVTLCLENLCPVYPSGSSVCHDPWQVRRLVKRLASPVVRMLLDVGHAHVVADREGIELAEWIEPLLDVVSLFHVHDNLGARRNGRGSPELDPLRLDLHLPPKHGTLPWGSIASALAGHSAPLVLEIHPSHRPAPTALREACEQLLLPRFSP
jgi:sugar phosphate isomerase/epimerase